MNASVRHDCSAIRCHLQDWLKLFGTTVVMTQTSQSPHTMNITLWIMILLLDRFPPLASMDLLLGKVGSRGLIQSVGYTTARKRPALSAMYVSTYAKLSRSQARDPHTGWDSAVFTLMVMYDN